MLRMSFNESVAYELKKKTEAKELADLYSDLLGMLRMVGTPQLQLVLQTAVLEEQRYPHRSRHYKRRICSVCSSHQRGGAHYVS